jgi:hypothetical protein
MSAPTLSSSLATYSVQGCERSLRLEPTPTEVRLVDIPTRGAGETYLVEADVAPDGDAALRALIVDYIAHAQKLNCVPMSPDALRRVAAPIDA